MFNEIIFEIFDVFLSYLTNEEHIILKFICKHYYDLINKTDYLIYKYDVHTRNCSSFVLDMEQYEQFGKYIPIKEVKVIKNWNMKFDINKYKNVKEIHVKMEKDFDDEIKQLPKNVTKFKFNDTYNRKIIPFVFHDTKIKELELSKKYNQIIEPNVLPKNLEYIRFDWDYNQKLEINVIPDSVKYIIFYVNYNQKIDVGVLPSSLKSLCFSSDYSKYIDVGVLPEGLEYLSFGQKFRQKFEKNILPNSLKELHFGKWYDEIIEKDVLPKSLKSLSFGRNYNQEINIGVLPEGLEYLAFGDSYNNKIKPGVLPNSLIGLDFNIFYSEKLYSDTLPSSLLYIRYSDRRHGEYIFEIDNVKEMIEMEGYFNFYYDDDCS